MILEFKSDQIWFDWTIFIDIVYLKTITFSCLQFTNISFESWPHVFSFLLSFTLFVLFTYYPYHLYRIFSRCDLKEESYRLKYWKIFRVYDSKDKAMIEVYTLIRKWIFGLGLVLFRNHRLLQLLLLVLTNLWYLIICIRIKPYKYKKINYFKTVTEAMFFISYCMLLGLVLVKRNITIDTYKKIGWSICYLYYVLLVGEIIILLMRKKEENKSEKKVELAIKNMK